MATGRSSAFSRLGRSEAYELVSKHSSLKRADGCLWT